MIHFLMWLCITYCLIGLGFMIGLMVITKIDGKGPLSIYYLMGAAYLWPVAMIQGDPR